MAPKHDPNAAPTRAARAQPTIPHAVRVDEADADSFSADNLIREKLENAKQAARSGDRNLAYQLSQEAVQIAPDNVQALLYAAALTNTYQDRLAYLGKALSLAPQNARAWRDLYLTLKRYMEGDPYLRYLEETDGLYRVLTGNGYLVTVPKDRAVTLPYPPPEPTPLDPAFRWLRFALIGLLLAGLLTVVCAPIAIFHAWRVRAETKGTIYQRRVQMISLYACILWAVGIALIALFLLHL